MQRSATSPPPCRWPRLGSAQKAQKPLQGGAVWPNSLEGTDWPGGFGSERGSQQAKQAEGPLPRGGQDQTNRRGGNDVGRGGIGMVWVGSSTITTKGPHGSSPGCRAPSSSWGDEHSPRSQCGDRRNVCARILKAGALERNSSKKIGDQPLP